MLSLLGIKLHPGLRAVLGVALLAFGIAAHVAGAMIAGAAFLAWSVIGALTARDQRRDDAPGR